MAGSERRRELRRRRKRSIQMQKWASKAQNVVASEKPKLVEKIRRATPAAEIVLERLEIK